MARRTYTEEFRIEAVKQVIDPFTPLPSLGVYNISSGVVKWHTFKDFSNNHQLTYLRYNGKK